MGFEVGFHLWEVEIWAEASADRLVGIVEEVEAEIEEGTRDGVSVNGEMLFFEMPASRTDDESG